mmetsp:Transcript_13617/g.20084  ORF Transcript_13617/g.20084 Transcript_13617/m.20084 type:complete len:96 (+) Transcript_13617:200-487(+)
MNLTACRSWILSMSPEIPPSAPRSCCQQCRIRYVSDHSSQLSFQRQHNEETRLSSKIYQLIKFIQALIISTSAECNEPLSHSAMLHFITASVVKY